MAASDGIASAVSWQARVAAKKEKGLAGIPRDWRLPEELLKGLNANSTSPTNLIQANAVRRSGILSNDELNITEKWTAGELLKIIRDGQLSAEEVTVAFAKRAAVAQQLTSCLTEIFFQQAIERAQYLDNYLKTEGRPFGPLHGLPISLKDSFGVKGVDSTIGYVSFIDNSPAATNSPLVQLLLDLGAVPYVKTNIPQTLMTADSENNIFGRTLNPHNTSLTAGGSSGGEGALVAARGSILGVGTDIAGSIRIPSLCCGVYGFKPSADRIPFGGQVSPGLLGAPGITPVAGPLATSIADLRLFVKSVLDAVPWKYDATALAVPWIDRKDDSADELRKRPLKIGVLAEDPIFPLHPPVRRVLTEAATALANAGNNIIPLPFDNTTSTSTACRIAFEMFALDPLDTAISHLKRGGEPLVQSLKNSQPPNESRKVYSIDMLAALNVERKEFAESWRRLWIDNDLDVVLAPGAQNTAVPHDTYGLPPYTVIWNLLDYPACIIPYGKASKSADSKPLLIEAPAKGPNYLPEEVDGAPCAVQIIAPRFRDEECLAVAEIMDQILNGEE